ncbi:cell division protein ZapA [Peredibacter sp. HCB2-198]|uniref:Cell division protein ZapA n=1 Tax=Peredibacter starrii TaxID=28202 RepID=A0AAX4HRX4_9BACT|nr:cell division protein ZapA [Peredibacter starrii]WPU65664.1 cell division protein ZapA [Peredibacter starrii]
MTESQEKEFNVLGCKVKLRPDQNDSHNAKAVIDLVMSEIQDLKMKRPLLKDTDVAVLVALKIATEKLQLEDEYKSNILKLENSLESVLELVSVEAN